MFRDTGGSSVCKVASDGQNSFHDQRFHLSPIGIFGQSPSGCVHLHKSNPFPMAENYNRYLHILHILACLYQLCVVTSNLESPLSVSQMLLSRKGFAMSLTQLEIWSNTTFVYKLISSSQNPKLIPTNVNLKYCNINESLRIIKDFKRIGPLYI